MPSPVARLRIDGQTRNAIALKIRTDGQTRTIAGIRSRPPANFALGWEAGGQWTSMAREDDFWHWLPSVPDVTTRTLGTTLQGRSIRAATLGNPDGPAVLIVGGVHGREPAGREVAMMTLRDLAAAGGNILDTHHVVFMPNANPDGRANNTRENSEGFDINRDMYRLDTAEGEAIAHAIRDYQPVMIIDLHQYNGDGIHHFWPQGNPRPNTPSALNALAGGAVNSALSVVSNLGFPSTPYPLARRGTVNESATFHHCVGLLAESRAVNYTSADVVQILRAATDTWLGYLQTNSSQLVAARAASLDIALTSTGPESVNITNIDITTGNTFPISIAGYDLAEPLPQKYIDAFDIQVEGNFVPIQQPARGILPEILDPQSTYKVLQATRRAA